MRLTKKKKKKRKYGLHTEYLFQIKSDPQMETSVCESGQQGFIYLLSKWTYQTYSQLHWNR